MQLAHRYPRFREELVEVLRSGDIEPGSFDWQLEKLILGPFETTQIQTLIIIDGLDKCDGSWYRDPERVLSALSAHMILIPNVKFLITCSSTLAQFFPSPAIVTPPKKLSLDTIERSLVDADIKSFLRTKLGEFTRVPEDQQPEDWPDSHYVDDLCSRAGGKFSVAALLIDQVVSEKILKELEMCRQDLQEIAQRYEDRPSGSRSRHAGTR